MMMWAVKAEEQLQFISLLKKTKMINWNIRIEYTLHTHPTNRMFFTRREQRHSFHTSYDIRRILVSCVQRALLFKKIGKWTAVGHSLRSSGWVLWPHQPYNDASIFLSSRKRNNSFEIVTTSYSVVVVGLLSQSHDLTGCCCRLSAVYKQQIFVYSRTRDSQLNALSWMKWTFDFAVKHKHWIQ